jgi:hypothetical protein
VVLIRAFILILLVPTVGLADDWDSTRQKLIDPLNSALHAHWPTQLKNRDLDVLVRLYATQTGTGLTWEDSQQLVEPLGSERILRWVGPGGDEPIRERYRRLLDLFADIHRADLRIDRVDWRNPGPMGYRATVRLIVKGRGPDGDLRQLEQHATLRVRFFDPFWEITAEEITARTLITLDRPRYEWVSDAVGIRNIHANELSPPFRLFGTSEDNPVRQGSGVAVGDVDGDGCEDLVLAGSPKLALYRSRCDGTFEDATVAAGLPPIYPAAASGVVFFDYDNDGWSDLYVAAVAGGDRLYRNEGHGHYVDVTERAGIPRGRWGSMPVVADYDRDGFLDVYVSGMGDHERTAPRPTYDARNGVRGTLLRNRGDGTFADVSSQAGVDSPGWDMVAAWGDYDGDGWPDLYVANEFGNNRLYRNEQNGTFSERASETGTADGGSAMGVAWGDIDGDGDLDLFVSGMHANSGWVLFHPKFPALIPWYFRLMGLFTDNVQRRADSIIDQLSRGNSLFRNEGDGTFTDISDSAAVRDGQWTWAAQFLDYDNDGRLDLYAVNGFITGPQPDDL